MAANGRLGRETAFAVEPVDDPVFDARLSLVGSPSACWIVLRYRVDPVAQPLRPMLRLLRRRGPPHDFVLPGAALGGASWLGMLPADLSEIRLALPPGYGLERIGLRSHASVLGQCLAEHPFRFAAALYAAMRRDERRYRDILRGACAVTPTARYPVWRAARVREPDGSIPVSDLTIRLVLPATAADAGEVARTVRSLIEQTHRAWTLVITRADHDSARIGAQDARISEEIRPNSAPVSAHIADADALGFLRPGDRLTPDTLAILAAYLADPAAPVLVYADEEIDGSSLQPRLKPDWSPDLALVSGYYEGACLLSRSLIARLGTRAAGCLDGSDIALAAIGAAERIVHVPRILVRRLEIPFDPLARARSLERHLAVIGSPARPEIVAGVLDLHWPLPVPVPLVSVVIPSRDRFDLIGRVTQDLLRRTDYPTIQLIIVDNGSSDRDVLDLYDGLRTDPRVRIVSYPRPFNYAAMINAGVRAADGQVLVLLNNDISVLEPGWLAALIAQAVRPEVGAVGAKLLYADGRLQHAGVVVGLGGRAGHILRRRPGDMPGHLDRMRVAHEVSAVTAACLAVTRVKFDAVGGLDEEAFAIDFNDVDFCLRLNALGWKSVWTPKAVLAHLESVSRGPARGAARARFEREAEAFAARWQDVIRHDPFYHPSLSLTTFGEDLE